MAIRFTSNFHILANESIPQKIEWPARHPPKDLRGKTGLAIIPQGKTFDTLLTEEDTQVMQELGVQVRSGASPQVAFYIVKDNDPAWRVDPQNAEFRQILKHATESNIPVYPLSYFHLCKRNIDLPRSQTWEVEPFVLHEGVDSLGRLCLTQGEDFDRFTKAKGDDAAFDNLGRLTLFKDPYVEYVKNLLEEEKIQLLQHVVDNPPRLISTRWKIHMVLNEYLASAWLLDGKTWTFDFDEELFATENAQRFHPVQPIIAIRAAILVFLGNPDLYRS
ncbi:hypothetical protein BC936DRAFT_144575 [Jimgerdemannia flammicorona]|nr:hypothetical protein BC936DRAFT_144575 [Jimgerdemannia flammicorona]